MITHRSPRSPLARSTQRLAIAAVILAVVAAASPALAASITRGPYLQLLTTQSVTIVWNTDAPAACSLAIGPVGGSGVIIGGPTGTVCAIPVTGLSPGTSYSYTPLADSLPLAAESVFTTDDPRAPFSFLVVGDSGCGCGPQYAVRDTMAKIPEDFILHTGDMIYETGDPADFNPEFFVPYAPLIRQLVFWPVLGNHDVETSAGAPWRDAFYTPANNPAATENYFSFDFGNAHVVVVDSNQSTSPGSPQYVFLDHELAASTAVWKFVAFHHTIYSSGAHGSNLAIQANLVPLFDKHAVDIVFMGHDHDYERTKPLRANQVVAPGSGTVYITTGGGGRELRPVGVSSFTASSESIHHVTRVAVNGGTLLEQMVRPDGSIGDTMTLVKGVTGPAPRCGDNLVNQPSEQCDGDDHPACLAGCAPDCTCTPVCGDGHVNQASEVCDNADDAACPGLCLADCSCGTPSQFVTLAPIADTYIEAGTQATWDHGASDHLDADQKPMDISYLKFDLSAVSIPVTRASLTLSCTNTSNDGGTVYPVADSSWVEGNRTGLDSTSANGPGLKWVDVDTNGDGTVDAHDTSPFVPDFAHWLGAFPAVTSGQSYTVQLRGAFQQGPKLYTLAFTNSSQDGAAYASRSTVNTLQRPRLRLELASPLPSTSSTTTTTASTVTSITSTSTVTTTVPTTTSTTLATTLLEAVVADVSVDEKPAPKNFGADPILEVDGQPGKSKRTFLRFNVSDVGSRQVTRVRLRLQVASNSGNGSGGSVHRIATCGWNELTMNWNTQPPIDGPVLAAAGPVGPGAIVNFDVSSAVHGNGLYCFAVESVVPGGVAYNSREGSPLRPSLLVDLAP